MPFCDDLSVLVKLSDLQALLEASAKLDQIVADNAVLSSKYDALYGLYSQLLVKLNSIERFL